MKWLLPAAICFTLSSCVLPQDTEAGGIEEIPHELFTTTTSSPASSEPEDQEYELSLFWHNDQGQLVRVPRSLDQAPTIELALSLLLQLPTEEDLLEFGVITPRVVEALNPVATFGENGVLTILVADEFAFREREDQKIPITQELVCTLIGIEGVAAIKIADSDGEIALSDIQAGPIASAATTSDFDDCLIAQDETIDQTGASGR